MKKLCTLLLALAMLLAACGSAPPAHSHVPGSWVVELNEHGRACSVCGEAMAREAHMLKDGVCTICGAQITDSDGFFSLALFDGHGNPILRQEVYPDGEVKALGDRRWTYTYDSDGNLLTEKAYLDGELRSECEYALNDSGERYTLRRIDHYGEGARNYREFDPYGYTTREEMVESDGTVSFCEEYENIVDGNGELRAIRKFVDGVLIDETEYGNFEEDGWALRTTIYLEDGSREVKTYDPGGKLLSEALYDAQGET